MNYNKKAVEELWKEHEPYIRRICTYKLESMSDYIDDCIQDVFLDLSDALHKGKVIENPRAWLTSVVNNKIKDIYEHSRKEAQRLIPFDRQNLENTHFGAVYDEHFSVGEEQIAALSEKVLNMLDEKEQQLLSDRFKLGKPISVIAEEYNTTENNIYQKLFRLKQKTKMLIKKVLDDTINLQ